MDTTAKQDVVAFLADILGARRPTTDGVQIIAPDVEMHMDKYGFSGFDGWKSWLDFIHSRNRVADLTFTPNDIVENDDGTLTLTGVWHGVYQGEQMTSGEGFARYRVEDGMVKEIWTRRANYVFQFGPTMRHAWRWYAVFAQFAFWVKIGGGRKMVMSAADKAA